MCTLTITEMHKIFSLDLITDRIWQIPFYSILSCEQNDRITKV